MKNVTLLSVLLCAGCSLPNLTNNNLQSAEEMEHEAEQRRQNMPTPVADYMKDADFLSRYKRELCKSKTELECNRAIDNTFFAKLHERYPYASERAFLNWCKANPFECRDNKEVEHEYQDMNSAAITRAENADRDERSRQSLRSLSGYLQQRGNKQVTECDTTTNSLGDRHTTCTH